MPDRLSEDGRTAYATVSYDVPVEELDGALPSLSREGDRRHCRAPGPRSRYRRRADRRRGDRRVPVGELAGLAIALVLLIAVLRSLRAAGNALLAALAGVGIGFGLLLWGSTATDVPGLAPTLAGMLGIGAGIDYALLLAARQREELRGARRARPPRSPRPRQATPRSRRPRSCWSRSPGCWSPGSRSSGAPAWRRASSCSPARSPPSCSCRRASRGAGSGCVRAARGRREPRALPWAARRPWAALVAATLATGALAAPAGGLELGQPDDRNLGPDATQRQAYDRLASAFGPGVNGPLVVAVALPESSGDRALAQLHKRIASDREVAAVTVPARNKARERRGADGHAAPRAAGRRDPRARRPAARSRDPGGRRRHRRRGLRRRPHRALRRRGRAIASGSRCSRPRSSASRCCCCS